MALEHNLKTILSCIPGLRFLLSSFNISVNVLNYLLQVLIGCFFIFTLIRLSDGDSDWTLGKCTGSSSGRFATYHLFVQLSLRTMGS